jgi:hypothetical protein
LVVLYAANRNKMVSSVLHALLGILNNEDIQIICIVTGSDAMGMQHSERGPHQLIDLLRYELWFRGGIAFTQNGLQKPMVNIWGQLGVLFASHFHMRNV